MLSKPAVLSFALGVMALGLAACGGGSPYGGGASPADTPTPTSPSEAVTETTAAGAAAARQIEVQTTSNLTFNPSQLQVKPGDTVEFVIKNTSGFGHTFTIASSRAKGKIWADVRIGGNETETVRVTFPEEPGELYLFCRPHESQGMTGVVEVDTESGSKPTTPTPERGNYDYSY